MDKPKLTYTEHIKSDSKLLWTILLVIGYLTGGLTNLTDVLKVPLDSTFVTHEELDAYPKCNCVDKPTDNGVILVPPGETVPKIVPKSTDT